MTAHAEDLVDRFDCADQHLLWVATTECASTTQGERVDDGDAPSGSAVAVSGDRGAGSGSGADDDEVVLLDDVRFA
jgi:hypothetical protein